MGLNFKNTAILLKRTTWRSRYYLLLLKFWTQLSCVKKYSTKNSQHKEKSRYSIRIEKIQNLYYYKYCVRVVIRFFRQHVSS